MAENPGVRLPMRGIVLWNATLRAPEAGEGYQPDRGYGYDRYGDRTFALAGRAGSPAITAQMDVAGPYRPTWTGPRTDRVMEIYTTVAALEQTYGRLPTAITLRIGPVTRDAAGQESASIREVRMPVVGLVTVPADAQTYTTDWTTFKAPECEVFALAHEAGSTLRDAIANGKVRFEMMRSGGYYDYVPPERLSRVTLTNIDDFDVPASIAAAWGVPTLPLAHLEEAARGLTTEVSRIPAFVELFNGREIPGGWDAYDLADGIHFVLNAADVATDIKAWAINEIARWSGSSFGHYIKRTAGERAAAVKDPDLRQHLLSAIDGRRMEPKKAVSGLEELNW